MDEDKISINYIDKVTIDNVDLYKYKYTSGDKTKIIYTETDLNNVNNIDSLKFSEYVNNCESNTDEVYLGKLTFDDDVKGEKNNTLENTINNNTGSSSDTTNDNSSKKNNTSFDGGGSSGGGGGGSSSGGGMLRYNAEAMQDCVEKCAHNLTIAANSLENALSNAKSVSYGNVPKGMENYSSGSANYVLSAMGSCETLLGFYGSSNENILSDIKGSLDYANGVFTDESKRFANESDFGKWDWTNLYNDGSASNNSNRSEFYDTFGDITDFADEVSFLANYDNTFSKYAGSGYAQYASSGFLSDNFNIEHLDATVSLLNSEFLGNDSLTSYWEQNGMMLPDSFNLGTLNNLMTNFDLQLEEDVNNYKSMILGLSGFGGGYGSDGLALFDSYYQTAEGKDLLMSNYEYSDKGNNTYYVEFASNWIGTEYEINGKTVKIDSTKWSDDEKLQEAVVAFTNTINYLQESGMLAATEVTKAQATMLDGTLIKGCYYDEKTDKYYTREGNYSQFEWFDELYGTSFSNKSLIYCEEYEGQVNKYLNSMSESLKDSLYDSNLTLEQQITQINLDAKILSGQVTNDPDRLEELQNAGFMTLNDYVEFNEYLESQNIYVKGGLDTTKISSDVLQAFYNRDSAINNIKNKFNDAGVITFDEMNLTVTQDGRIVNLTSLQEDINSLSTLETVETAWGIGFNTTVMAGAMLTKGVLGFLEHTVDAVKILGASDLSQNTEIVGEDGYITYIDKDGNICKKDALSYTIDEANSRKTEENAWFDEFKKTDTYNELYQEYLNDSDAYQSALQRLKDNTYSTFGTDEGQTGYFINGVLYQNFSDIPQNILME